MNLKLGRIMLGLVWEQPFVHEVLIEASSSV